MRFRVNSGKAVNHPRRTARRKDAQVRKEERSKLTNSQQLVRLGTRPGESKRERNRLVKCETKP